MLFVNAVRGDASKSFKLLENFYKMRIKSPELFLTCDMECKEVQDTLDHQDYIGLPVTPDNCDLIFVRLSSFDPIHFVLDDSIRTFVHVLGRLCNTNSEFRINTKKIILRSIFFPQRTTIGTDCSCGLHGSSTRSHFSDRNQFPSQSHQIHRGSESHRD